MADKNLDEYMLLLDKAKSKLPHETEVHERLKIPEAEIMVEGKTTVIRNFSEIADVIRRDPQHMFGYLLRELGTAGTLEGKRATFKGNISNSQVQDRLSRYVDEYVMCSECNRPDTKIVKEGRVQILVCETCGAHRPVRVRKSGKQETTGLREGDVYEMQIEDIGKRGDGIARNGDYIIFVPGTTKGVQVKVKIVKISGRTAFGTVVQ